MEVLTPTLGGFRGDGDRLMTRRQDRDRLGWKSVTLQIIRKKVLPPLPLHGTSASIVVIAGISIGAGMLTACD